MSHEEGCPARERAYYGCSCEAIRQRAHTEALNRHTEAIQHQDRDMQQRVNDLETELVELRKNAPSQEIDQ